LRALALGPSALLRDQVKLVADDQVILTKKPGALVATAPAALRGRLEVRGIGILEVAATAQCEIVLVADLVRKGPMVRLPDPWPVVHILDFEVPLMRLLPFEDSAPLKLVAALTLAALPRIK
jgi:serine kinase of HPr protein (carbohydrate metabolism regulator)